MRDVAMRFMSRFPDRKEIGHFDIRKQKIDKILLARPNFRMGNSILAIPGIHFFRKNFPNARIDFVGSPAAFWSLPGAIRVL
jgi:heptosyltransferase-3